MKYHFSEKQFDVNYKELCQYSHHTKQITSHIPGWRKNSGTIFIDAHFITPEMFLDIFIGIGHIRSARKEKPPKPNGPL